MNGFALGLTGSIGMGKSTTAQMFRDADVPVWDADATVHRLYEKEGRAVPYFSEQIPGAVVDGAISRPVLREIISKDLAVLGLVESIVHPLVREDRCLFEERQNGLAVFDIPLLFETSADEWLDAVLVVSAPEDIQRKRVLSRPGMTEEHFADIKLRQIPDAEKRARADYVIETLELDATRQAVHDLIEELKGKLQDA